MDLKNSVAYITGGSKGIGFGIAQKLLEAGMKVAISGRNPNTLAEAVAQLGANDRILGIRSNVARLEDEEVAVQQILEKWGQLDVVIANAGVGHFAAGRRTDHDSVESDDRNQLGWGVLYVKSFRSSLEKV